MHAAGVVLSAWGPLGFTVRTVALRDGGMPLGAIARVHVAEHVAEALGIAVVAAVAASLEPAALRCSSGCPRCSRRGCAASS